MAYKMWLKRFQRDPSILGKSFILNGTPTTLIGIMPKRFTKRGADIWISANLDRTDTRWFVFQARIKRSVTYKQVAADLLPSRSAWRRSSQRLSQSGSPSWSRVTPRA